MENEEGNFNQLKLWKLKSKVCPLKTDPPMGKKDEKGTIITAPSLLRNLYQQTYSKRLEHRIMKTELMDIFFLKEELWLWRIEEIKNKKTIPWNEDDLKKALKSLKNNKTVDPNGMVNELLKSNCAGNNLLKSLLLLYNGTKMNFHIPRFMILQNITSIFKNKGNHLKLWVEPYKWSQNLIIYF